MVEEKKKGKLKGIVIAAFLFMIIAQVVHTLGSYATMDFYTDPQYFALWSEIMMPDIGPPGIEFFALSVAFNFITAFIFTWFYSLIKGAVPGKMSFMKGINYGLILFLITAFPGFLSMVLLLNIPIVLNVGWMIEALIIDIIGGIVIAKFVK